MTTSIDQTSQESPSDLAFVLHYRKDTEDRWHNLKTATKYLTTKFPQSTVLVVNDDKIVDLQLRDLPVETVMFCENYDEFKKSYCFNSAVDALTNNWTHNVSVFCFWDVDVLIDEKFVIDAYLQIKDGIQDHVYPFNGTFIDVQHDLFQDFLTRYNFEHINKLWKAKHPSLHFASGESPGGCTMISKEAFDRMGGYDSRFIGWGFEDTDFLYRSRKVNRVSYLTDEEAICWHLHHENAKRLENPHYHNNLRIFNQNAQC